jgi:hypothetical protein
METIKFARKCDFTGEGMNEGWCFGDGEKYAKYEGDALKHCQDLGYDSIADAYDDEAVYWTEWEDESEYQYELIDGKLVEIQ